MNNRLPNQIGWGIIWHVVCIRGVLRQVGLCAEAMPNICGGSLQDQAGAHFNLCFLATLRTPSWRAQCA